MTLTSPICLQCKHFDYEEFTGLFCKAFPSGIPEVIIIGKDDHQTPIISQENDLVFEKKS